MDYAFRRLTSFAVVGGVFAGFVSATLLASAGLPDQVAVGAGVLAFVVIPSIATGLAARRRTIQREAGPI